MACSMSARSGAEAARHRDADGRAEFVDFAVRVHARGRLRDPPAVEQARFAVVSGARVDLHRGNYGTGWGTVTDSARPARLRAQGSGLSSGSGRAIQAMVEVRNRRSGQRAPPAPAERQAFRRRLLAWYDRNGRDLPWRRATDPYQILVSEIMLQQTQVDRVLPKYHEWLERFPSLEALAARPVKEAVETWYPLGYNIRPRRLHSIAREAVARYGGALPSDEQTLLSFKGIGPIHGRRDSQLRVRPAGRHPRHERRAGAVPRVRRQGRPETPRRSPAPLGRVARGPSARARLRLQPGADGLRGDGLPGAQTTVPDVPDAAELRGFEVCSRQVGGRQCVTRALAAALHTDATAYCILPTATTLSWTSNGPHRRHRRRRRTRWTRARHSPPRGLAHGRALGVPGRQVRAGRAARRLPGARVARGTRRHGDRSRGDLPDDVRVRRPRPGLEVLPVRPCARSRARCSARRSAGFSAHELETLEFPPADAELVARLAASR